MTQVYDRNKLPWDVAAECDLQKECEDVKKWFVKGGEYVNTNFNELLSEEEKYGPYVSYDEAYVKWAERAWRTVDNCHSRYQIVRE